MLIYTHPHVLTYRRRHRETSWIRALWAVIKSGGDSDQRQPKRRRMPKERKQRGKFSRKRRDSLRNEPVVVDVGDSFVGDVERIRSNYYSSDASQRYRTFGSNHENNRNIEEGEQDVLDLRNIQVNLDVAGSFVDCIEQTQSKNCSDDEK